MRRRPPRSTRTDTLCPYTTLFRSAHAADQRVDGEHGHCHTFVRPKGMPPGVRPAPLPGFAAPADPNDALSHLVAIAMTPGGLPFRLFRSEEHTSELQSLMRISYAVFCLKKKRRTTLERNNKETNKT